MESKQFEAGYKYLCQLLRWLFQLFYQHLRSIFQAPKRAKRPKTKSRLKNGEDGQIRFPSRSLPPRISKKYVSFVVRSSTHELRQPMYHSTLLSKNPNFTVGSIKFPLIYKLPLLLLRSYKNLKEFPYLSFKNSLYPDIDKAIWVLWVQLLSSVFFDRG